VKELKKYPFSKKAVSAMLAATVALSPVLTTGNVFQPTTVEAATADFDTVTKLVEYLDSIYGLLSKDEKTALDTARNQLNTIVWEDYADDISADPTTNLDAKKELIGAILDIIVSTNVLQLEGKIETFRETQADRVDLVFGSDVTVDQILDFLAQAEINYLAELKKLNLDNSVSDTVLLVTLVDAMKATKNSSTANEAFGDKFFAVVDPVKTLLVLSSIPQITNLNADAKAALISALKKVQPAKDPEPGSTGGGSTTIPPTGNEVTTVITDTNVATLVNQITADNNTLEINLEDVANGQVAKAQLPASLFTEALKKNPNAIIVIKTKDGSYRIPASQINVAQAAEKLGVAVKDVKFNVYINAVNAPASNKLKLASKVIDYTLEAVAGTKKETISTFSTYVDRTVNGATAFNTNNSVAVKFNADGTVSSIPTLFKDKEATIKSLTNSTYAIVENNLTFPDVDNKKSWAENYIETLANKLIIQGKTDGKFAPGEEMTRAQFTVLLVKALGLPGGKYEQKFKDVKEADWFNLNGELAAAIKTGIIQGKPDGRFAPNEKITRTQAAIMLNRAMKLDFLKYDMAKLDNTKKVTDFKDTVKLDAEAKASIEAIYQAGIISGKPDGTFDPKGNTRRDQMAKMLAEFLISAKLMNEIK
jgi:hypothetical protein